ncbi:glycoside hydrolase family 78 protein [Cellulomonas endophytica]|uniref:glycoside hydrolase family 78 protein n=1 Tax=Cellulomonas endophytica TaxID=2494735 RepID=UPI0010104044|nr:glycoside hydrolase family 78 protein [Cellulomonas endophytica]
MPAAHPGAPVLGAGAPALGLGTDRPSLSWVTTAPAGWVQVAYELELVVDGVARTTGRVESPDSVALPWPLAPLGSRARVEARVRLWGRGDDRPSRWSDVGRAETGLLAPSDWTARLVGPAWEEGTGDDRRPPLVRGAFRLASPAASARLYLSAHGLVEAELNGVRVGDETLAPGWTVYHQRLQYSTFDVTDLLVPGENALGAWLADGWYRGRLGFHGGHHDLYGSDLGVLAQLEVRHPDGTTTTVGSDGTWTSGRGPVLASGLYDGERYDARLLPAGWSRPGFVDPSWTPVVELPLDPGVLVAPDGPPVRCTEELRPAAVWTSPAGRTLVDLGQNLSGRLRLRLRGVPAGTTITLRHAEVLQEGELYTRPLRDARATDVYVHDGVDAEWEPRFTMHGFRYAEVTGWPGALTADDVVGRAYHSDMAPAGTFSSSDPLLDRLHENIRWSMRSNFVHVPTDCPQRDERLGWTGDLQVFAPTATFLYDCLGLLRGWLKDVAAEQLEDGTVPWYVPVIPGDDPWTPVRPGAVWGDVAVLTPWVLYERTGDPAVLAQQYPSAKAWVELVERLAGPGRVWDTGFQLGDWLDAAAPPEDPADARTDRYLVATAYFAWSARHLARTAEVLGHEADAHRFAGLADEVRKAFLDRWSTGPGVLSDDAETAYALSICFDLWPDEEQRRAAGERLAALVAAGGDRVTTGFAGTPLLTDALATTGHLDRAYALLLGRECPSWLYTVLSGGTTTWERWDSLLPDGTVNPGGMTSFNHYAFGAVGDWLHRTVAGLAPAAPGYRRLRVHPRPGGGLTAARAEHRTPYGTAAVRWTLEAGRFVVDVRVPTGTTAVVVLPGEDERHVGSGEHRFEVPVTASTRF